ncbi:hypothetical protein EZS27_012449 [termite gut metagenome]|uniref:Uncharacterized protein n=1 Tax=termite gut metagenome TaxID=433724 RepID=A0A5J4S331_9ZZZZ
MHTFRGYPRILSDTCPIPIRSMTASEADIDARKSPPNTLQMSYELLCLAASIFNFYWLEKIHYICKRVI